MDEPEQEGESEVLATGLADDDDQDVLGEHYCRACDEPIRLRSRTGEATYLDMGSSPYLYCGGVRTIG